MSIFSVISVGPGKGGHVYVSPQSAFLTSLERSLFIPLDSDKERGHLM